MYLKGIIYSLYKNKLVKFYPKTLAEQVLLNKDSTTTLLDKLVSIGSGEVTTDPNAALTSGQTYTISNSDKMPTKDNYALTTIKYDDESMFQSAITISTQQKVERWCVDGTWSAWSNTSSSSLTLTSVSVKCTIETDGTYTFKNPITNYDENIQDISALVINTSYLTQDKFTITATSITIHDTENPVDRTDDVYVILHQLVKSDGITTYTFDGSRIATKSITGDKIADSAFMTTDDVVNGTGNNKIVGKAALDKINEIIMNDIYNIYPDHEVISIAHTLGKYPIVRVLCGQYGFGVGGIGVTPMGGSNITTIPCKTEFTDKTNIKLYIPKNYMGQNPSLKSVSANEFILTFSDSILSMRILLFSEEIIDDMIRQINNINDKLTSLQLDVMLSKNGNTATTDTTFSVNLGTTDNVNVDSGIVDESANRIYI